MKARPPARRTAVGCGIAIALGAALSFGAPLAAQAQQVTFMTGPQGGSWIPLGGALKGLWE